MIYDNDLQMYGILAMVVGVALVIIGLWFILKRKSPYTGTLGIVAGVYGLIITFLFRESIYFVLFNFIGLVILLVLFLAFSKKMREENERCTLDRAKTLNKGDIRIHFGDIFNGKWMVKFVIQKGPKTAARIMLLTCLLLFVFLGYVLDANIIFAVVMVLVLILQYPSMVKTYRKIYDRYNENQPGEVSDES